MNSEFANCPTNECNQHSITEKTSRNPLVGSSVEPPVTELPSGLLVIKPIRYLLDESDDEYGRDTPCDKPGDEPIVDCERSPANQSAESLQIVCTRDLFRINIADPKPPIDGKKPLGVISYTSEFARWSKESTDGGSGAHDGGLGTRLVENSRPPDDGGLGPRPLCDGVVRGTTVGQSAYCGPLFAIHECDIRLYVGSLTCAARTKLVTKDQLTCAAKYGDLIGEIPHVDELIVIIFEEPEEYFQSGYLEDARSFLSYLVFADRYGLNIPFICKQPDRIMWFLKIKEQQSAIWRHSQILLQPIEGAAFEVPKFGGGPAFVGIGGYPLVAPKRYPVATIKDVLPPEFLRPAEFTQMIEILKRNYADMFELRIVALLGSSIEYHMEIMNNAAVLELVREVKTFRYAAFYAFRLMYLNELSYYHGKCSTPKLLSLNAAAELPIYDGLIENNPYICTVVKNVFSSVWLCLPSKLMGARGLYSLAEFLLRMDVFTEGVFKYLKWDTGNSKAALTGSLITACAVKTPLEAGCKTLENYFAEYYPPRKAYAKPQRVARRRDNDEMFDLDDSDDENSCSDSDDAHGDNSAGFVQLGGNFDGGRSKCRRRRIWGVRRGVAVHANGAVAGENAAVNGDGADDATNGPINAIIDHNIDYTDIDLMIACPLADFDQIVQIHFESIKRAACEIDAFVIPVLERVETENKHKYIIRGLSRDIDMFHVEAIAPIIAKYHLGCVRAFFDGTDVLCFPSFISAAMTGMNIDIRWTSNRKDVRDIVLKYFQRGFGTLLNRGDSNNIITYSAQEAQWPNADFVGAANNRNARWARQRHFRMPLFWDMAIKMFNPSEHRCGIHHRIDSVSRHLQIPPIDTRVRQSGRRKRGKTGMGFLVDRIAVSPLMCGGLISYL